MGECFEDFFKDLSLSLNCGEISGFCSTLSFVTGVLGLEESNVSGGDGTADKLSSEFISSVLSAPSNGEVGIPFTLQSLNQSSGVIKFTEPDAFILHAASLRWVCIWR